VKKTTQAAARNIVGERVREARLRARPPISQDDLAGKLAAKGITIDQTAISRIEKKQRYLMDYEILAIAGCLRVPVAWLFGERIELPKRIRPRKHAK
jgi:HTH-type transcriptional regulator, cell division transcriptional repressor